MADDVAARAPGLAPVGRMPRREDEREAARRALALGLVNVLAASLAAAGQWASWRTENELDIHVTSPDWWRVLAVFAANLVPSGLAVVVCLRWVGVWRYGWRRRLAVLASVAAASSLVRLLLLATLRYSPADLWFVVVEAAFGVLAVVLAVSLALYDFDVGAELRAAEVRRREEEARAEQAAREAQQAELDVRRDVSRRLHGSLQQRLVILTHRLERLSAMGASGDGGGARDGMADELRALADELDEVRERDVRELSHALIPVGVDIGLREALMIALGRLPATVSTSVTLDPVVLERLDAPDRPHMAVADRLLVLDVVEEGVTNAVRHGSAHTIAVHLGVDVGADVAFTVTLDDDGSGLAPGAHESGLARLRERLAKRGGSLTLSARSEGGCRLVARLPLAVDAARDGGATR
ncbi:hypothetical protein ICW40_19675 [Actinotalea ferrariae]|uniref:sensor histidine kinase n=1 Tax=Actinotalea ferrariae TaxID=1386098 RepID=UPI001C8CD6B0|nr:ATP-binding protein [Actinotalea ferrariae]MBX9247014.1 hypothetical protein [Actinotalea ferrariae]